MSIIFSCFMVSGALGREIAATSIFVVENQKLSLSQRAQLHKEVTAIYEVTPKTTLKGLNVIFYNFEGIEVASKDTVFVFDADSGVTRRFTVKLRYYSTPAIFWVRISGHAIYTGDSRMVLARYLLSSETGEYGTMKELQYNSPLEYRFNPRLGIFEQEAFSFEKDRWQKNRAIIDTIKSIIDISDSLALLLYSEIPEAVYPPGILTWVQQGEYLLKVGWWCYKSTSERRAFLERLTSTNVEYLDRLEKEQIRTQRMERVKWMISWLLPVIMLLGLLTILLVLGARREGPLITSARFDRIIAAIVVILAIGIILYPVWPRPSFEKESIKREKQKYERVMKEQTKQAQSAYTEVDRLNLFGDLENCVLVLRSYRMSRQGVVVVFEYRDMRDSKMEVEYHFSVTAVPTDSGYKAVIPAYPLEAAIREFESNKRVAAFIHLNRIKRGYLTLGDAAFTVSIRDTVAGDGKKMPIWLEFNGKNNEVTRYSVPSDFDDEHYTEIRRLRNLCTHTGYSIRKDVSISYIQKAYGSNPGVATLVEGGGDDTLWVYFFSDKPDDFTFQWIPVPKNVKPPQQILDQLYTEFTRAGLPYAYAKDHLKIMSSCGLRQPNYFQGKGDRVILRAIVKWVTGVEWLDKVNRGEGVQFAAEYEYFADALKLGKSVGRPGKTVRKWREMEHKVYYLRPIRKVISYKEARDKLFAALPEELKFDNISAELSISTSLSDEGGFIYLVGVYSPPTRGDVVFSRSIRVDLETGEVKE